MKTLLTLFLAISLNSFAVEELYLVSDVDDTIKITRVGNAEMIIKGLQTKNYFLGLNDLYRMWGCYGLKVQRALCMNERNKVMAPTRRMSYVSGAPKPIHPLVKIFLKKNNFPAVPFFGRPSLRIHTLDFKIGIIEKMVKRNPRSKFILIGDNGEKDPKIYHTIAKKYPKKIKASYLHALYDIKGKKTALFPNQTAYLTSIDLGIHFYNEGWIEKDDLKNVVKAVMNTYSKKPRALIPQWFDCKKFFRYGLWPSIKKEKREFELQIMVLKMKNIIQGLKSCR